MSKSDWMYKTRYFLTLNLGLLFTALGIAVFKAPNKFVFGGTSGISIIISTLLPTVNVGLAMWIVNILLVMLGLCFLGFKRMGIMMYSSFALSFFVALLEKVLALTGPLTDDLFLEFCFAVILPAIGSALAFNIGASTGGTDIVAVVLNKYTSLEVGKALLVSDFGVVTFAFLVYGSKTGLYCLLGITLKSTIIDNVIEGLNLRKVCTVISKETEQIKTFITEQLHRSATEQVAHGAFTHEEKKVLMTVLTRSEATRLRNFLRKTDPKAFITIVNSSEIIGKGFRTI